MAESDFGLNDWDAVRGYVHGVLEQNHDDWHHQRIAYYIRRPTTLMGQYAIHVLKEVGDRRDWAALAESLARLGPSDVTVGCEVMEAGWPVEALILETMAAIDPLAAVRLLTNILQDKTKDYLHAFAVAQLQMMAGG